MIRSAQPLPNIRAHLLHFGTISQTLVCAIIEFNFFVILSKFMFLIFKFQRLLILSSRNNYVAQIAFKSVLLQVNIGFFVMEELVKKINKD